MGWYHIGLADHQHRKSVINSVCYSTVCHSASVPDLVSVKIYDSAHGAVYPHKDQQPGTVHDCDQEGHRHDDTEQRPYRMAMM